MTIELWSSLAFMCYGPKDNALTLKAPRFCTPGLPIAVTCRVSFVRRRSLLIIDHQTPDESKVINIETYQSNERNESKHKYTTIECFLMIRSQTITATHLKNLP